MNRDCHWNKKNTSCKKFNKGALRRSLVACAADDQKSRIRIRIKRNDKSNTGAEIEGTASQVIAGRHGANLGHPAFAADGQKIKINSNDKGGLLRDSRAQ
jgi:hypothetical protein